ncbi:MAG: hypothetical protein KC649_03340 [Candidatus Omnitrophica bacterium]|nr:hypothetical protein [Candidatus Omnitrophota bacterium]
MANNHQYHFKGDDFVNLYSISAEITTKSPLHIGTGETYQESPGDKSSKDDKKIPQIAQIDRDFNNLPYIPGSAIRGVVRHYLLNIFSCFGTTIAQDPDYDKLNHFRIMKQDDQVKYMETQASLLEQLFGTPFCESKIEFWDAHLLPSQTVTQSSYAAKGWNASRMSYVVRSVAIDPVTGAAEENKLYSFDVAPTGLKFSMHVVGRNLSDAEVGFLLLGLRGFNSSLYPLTIGAMSGRGFGRMNFKLNGIYKVDKTGLPQWLSKISQSGDAGYGALAQGSDLSAQAVNYINSFKQTFMNS